MKDKKLAAYFYSRLKQLAEPEIFNEKQREYKRKMAILNGHRKYKRRPELSELTGLDRAKAYQKLIIPERTLRKREWTRANSKRLNELRKEKYVKKKHDGFWETEQGKEERERRIARQKIYNKKNRVKVLERMKVFRKKNHLRFLIYKQLYGLANYEREKKRWREHNGYTGIENKFPELHGLPLEEYRKKYYQISKGKIFHKRYGNFNEVAILLIDLQREILCQEKQARKKH